VQHIGDLERQRAMRWRADERAWVADPDQVIHALAADGYEEYRREVAKHGSDRPGAGGMWQGLDPRTASVATVIWARQGTPAESHVFIEIDGRPVEGSAWTEIDDAVLGVVIDGGGRATPGEIAAKVGMSEDAVRSIIAMLAEQGKVRIVAVELPPRAA
jgi:hypothetical protein